MYVNDKCPCGNACCANGTCAACANDAIDSGVMDHDVCCGGNGAGGGHAALASAHMHSPLFKLVAVVLVIFLATLIANNVKKFQHIGVTPKQQNMLTISGSGKVTATPTIAVTSVGLVTEKADVAAAQSENS